MLPDEATAAQIFGIHFADEVSQVNRFPTGLCHYVYEVTTTGGKVFVVRIASIDSRPYLEGGLHWYPYLKNVGVPVPFVYASCLSHSFPYMLLERLPGSDLGQVYGQLSESSKKELAFAVARIQEAVSTLPPAQGFGFTFSYDQNRISGKRSWAEVVSSDISRSEERIRRVGHLEEGLAERVRSVLHHHESSLNSVKPVPFLDDLTTKNVIVHGGTLAGIVDTDLVCFGDPLFTIGLTKMALLTLGTDTTYVEYWLEAIKATQQQRAMVTFYTTVFCLGFMSELGQTFNQHVAFSKERADAYREIFERLIGSLEKKG